MQAVIVLQVSHVPSVNLCLFLVTNENIETNAPSSPCISNLFRHFGGFAIAEESNDSNELTEKLESSYHSMGLKQTTIIQLPQIEYKVNLGSISTYFIMLKAFIGIGVMYIPSYFSQMGYMVCIQIMCISTLVIGYGISKLIKCYGKFRVSYSILIGIVTFKCFQPFISFLLFIGSLTYGAVYMNYAVRNVTTYISCFIYCDSINVTKFISILVILFIISPLLCIRNWPKYYILFNISSVLLIMTLFSFSVPVAMIKKDLILVAYNEPTIKKLVYFIGTYSFSLEGFGTAIAFYQRTSIKGLYNIVFLFIMGTVLLLQILFGIFLSTVGDKREPPLPILDSTTLAEVLKFPATYSYCLSLLYLLCIIPGYYLTLLPALHRLEQILKYFFPITGCKGYTRHIARIIFGIITILLGLLIDSSIATIAVIMGYSICIPLMVIFPGVVHFLLIAESVMEKVLDMGLIVVGSGAIVFAIASLALI